MLHKIRLVTLRNVLPVLLGSAIYAFALHYFVIPNELMEGGITGIALLLNYALGLPPSVMTLALNIPLFILGWKFMDHQQITLSILGTVGVSFFLWIMEFFIASGWIVPFESKQDHLLATLYAGLTIGIGLGIVFRFGGTTGGSDIVARLGNKLRGWSMGQVILIFDFIVIASSLLYIPREKVLYTLVAVFIASRTIDFITEGAYAAKEFTIITESGDELARLITQEMDRGVTLFPGKGAYSQREKNVVYCVVARSEVRRLKTLVRSVDPRAFMIISDVHDVLGEGFRPE